MFVPVTTKPAPPRSKRAIRLQIKHPAVLILLGVVACGAILFGIVFTYFYLKYMHIVDDRIRRPIFDNPAKIYATGDVVEAGDERTAAGIVAELRASGYLPGSAQSNTGVGTYSLRGNVLHIYPGSGSYYPGKNATIRISGGEIKSITDDHGQSLSSYELEPALVTGLFDAKQRSKRRLLKYSEIPPLVINAIISVEDRRFFEHSGINYVRLVEGLLAPVFHHRRIQGGSTLTMQMARGFFLSNERSVKRKLAEMMIALILEHRFTKEQILEIYVNQVDLGQHGSFNIRGFGEAAQAYFGKDIRNLNLPEAALLAGLVNGPTYFSPLRHPARAIKRRNIVLRAMYDNHIIDQATLERAEATPLRLAPPSVEAEDAPYFVDIVRDRLLSEYDEAELDNSGMRVYTSLDRQLQRAATEAVESGMKQVDALIERRRTRKTRQGKGRNAVVKTEIQPGPMPQVALIALDPHTGEVLALAGGRDYAASQLNHALAKRPTGSIFKPFVYATAINTGLTGDPAKAFTQLTLIDASEGTFQNPGGKPYTPHNFDPAESTGQVPLRYALAHSINTATVRLAEMLGYDKVVQLAQAAGVTDVKPTPSMAIGTYDATPLEMSEAYTVFANGGVRQPAVFIRSIRSAAGEPMDQTTEEKTNVLDPRVASVITDMLGAVLDNGTAAAVRARFSAPAAGKTGTSHDAWFAGYTSNLLCIVWVGNDDYSDIKLEGAKAAAPIWTDFMLRAQKLRRYHEMQPFPSVQGVVSVKVDKATNLPADESCPDDYQALFIDGTVPAATCDHPEGPSANLFQKMFHIGVHRELVLPPVAPPATNPAAPPTAVPNQPAPGTPAAPQPEEKKKHGFWHRLFGGKKDRDKSTDTANTGSTAPQ